jgi:hypothetical protein
MLLRHALGMAIDINPHINPYIKGELILSPGATYDNIQPGFSGCPLSVTYGSSG